MKDLIELLEIASMSKLEARIYIHLLTSGPSIARGLSNSLDVNRIDIYRCLKDMRERGMVELILSKPFAFSAVDPFTLRGILISEQEHNMKHFKSSIERAQKLLEQLPKSKESNSKYELVKAAINEQFTIKTGNQIPEKWKNLVNSAESEVLVILSRIGLMTHSVEGFADVYQKAKERGIKVRMITDVNEQNVEQAIEFKNVCSLKILPNVDVVLRYVITDSRDVMVSMGSFSNNQKDFLALWTTKQLLIKAFKLDFEEKWRHARIFSGSTTSIPPQKLSAKKC